MTAKEYQVDILGGKPAKRAGVSLGIRKRGWSRLLLTSKETLDKPLTDEASVSSSVRYEGCSK